LACKLLYSFALLKRLEFLVAVGRLMMYENEKKNDKITSRTGQRGIEYCQRCFANVFTPIFTKGFYPTSVVCHSCTAAISKDRLPWYYTDVEGFFRPTQGLGPKEGTALLNSVLCREKAGKKRAFEELLKAIFKSAKAINFLDDYPQGAIDATGLETRHTSQHYIKCTKRPSYFRRRWPKITVVCDTKTHMIAACIVTRGPSHDFANLPKAMSQANQQVHFDQLLADAGYDSEYNHRFCREILGIRSTVIAYNSRRTRKLPSGKYRKQMAGNFDTKAYKNRWQVESVFSRNKRLLGSSLRARRDSTREDECLIRVLTHNLMIIRRAA